MHLRVYQGRFLRGVVLASFRDGGMDSIRFSVSSRPIPASSLCSAGGEFCGGLGLDRFPDFVARKLGLVGQALPFDALEQCRGALHVVDAELDPMVPAEIELVDIALQVLFADMVERADQTALE